MAKGKATSQEPMTQFSVRAPTDMVERLIDTAVKLGLDKSHLLRLMMAEKLPEYEERARQASSHRKRIVTPKSPPPDPE